MRSGRASEGGEGRHALVLANFGWEASCTHDHFGEKMGETRNVESKSKEARHTERVAKGREGPDV